MIEQLISLLKVERVDDIPVVLAQIHQMGLPAVLDQYYPTHGLWKGALSVGEVIAVWLTFIVSQGDHRLSHVQPWVEAHLETLTACVGQPIRPLDFSDDRLADLLDRLAETATWGEVETALNGVVLRVYELTGDRIRLDSTSAKTHAGVTEDGLFQFGHSKDHRADLPQVKISLAALDPLGLPLTTTVVSGNTADDPLYIPEIQRVQQTVGAGGKTYIGDCKLGALATRAWIVGSGDAYLCPLAGKQLPAEALDALLAPVLSGAQPLTPVYEVAAADAPQPPALLAEGYTVEVDLAALVDGQSVVWRERRLVVRSVALATQQAQQLDGRLQQALAEIDHLNVRKQGKKILDAAALTAAAEQILARRRVVGLIALAVETTVEKIPQRRYGPRPAQHRVKTHSTLRAELDRAAVAAAKQRLGWRVYATNQADLTLEAVVRAYREQYLIERNFGRLKGRALAITPLFLQTETRVPGLIRLLSLALRVLILVEFVARRHLADTQSKVTGLYPGQPARATAAPTAELLLRAFRGISLTFIEMAGQLRALLSPLSDLHHRLLAMLGWSADLYERLMAHFQKPALCLSEP
jgi:transposase